MKNKISFVFPGQGSQTVGMLAEMADRFDLIVKTFNQASQILDYDLWQLVCNGPEEQLNQTIYTQPAMLTADVALWRVWKEQGHFSPELMAGHSLGEYAALVASDAIEFSDAVKLVAHRAQLMQNVVAEGKGAMGVILALSKEQVVSVCNEVSCVEYGITQPVNFNAPGQTVIAGHTESVDRALELAGQLGAKKAKKLSISVPSHCDLMKSAAEKLAEYLEQVSMNTPKIPIINNVDVKIYEHPDEIKDALVRQLFNPVRWVEIIENMIEQGINIIIECGPGKVLTGLNKRIGQDLQLYAFNNVGSLQTLMNLPFEERNSNE